MYAMRQSATILLTLAQQPCRRTRVLWHSSNEGIHDDIKGNWLDLCGAGGNYARFGPGGSTPQSASWQEAGLQVRAPWARQARQGLPLGPPLIDKAQAGLHRLCL